MKIHTKRIYEPVAKTDGYRLLIDRLWPRGFTKEGAPMDKWMKDIAPSTELRKWYNHEPAKWEAFCKKYYAEIEGSAALQELLSDIRKHKTVTFLTASKNEEQNHAVALRQLVQKHLK